MLSILLSTLLTLAPVPEAGTVTVNVSGARSDDGQVVVLLWDDDDGFPRDASKAAHRATATLTDGTARIRLDDVPEGRYVVMAFHDEDENGEVATRFRMPREGIAMSRWSGGRPSFEDSLVRIGENSVVSVELRYL